MVCQAECELGDGRAPLGPKGGSVRSKSPGSMGMLAIRSPLPRTGWLSRAARDVRETTRDNDAAIHSGASSREGSPSTECPNGSIRDAIAPFGGGVVTQDTAPLVSLLLGAVIAAFGYVGKLLVESIQAWQRGRALRLAALFRLQALLNASRTAFLVQRGLAGRLAAQLDDGPTQPAVEGLERLFASRFAGFNEGESDLHMIIRAYSEHALRPINRSIRDWLQNDADYRTSRAAGPEGNLAN